MAMSMHTTLLATALFAVGVACQDTTQQLVFTYPPDGSDYTYHKMDTLIVNYTVPYDTAELSTFCEPGPRKLSASPQHPTNPTGLRQHTNNATVNRQTVPGRTGSLPILLGFVSDEPCWFDLRAGPDGDGTTNTKSSASFSILRNERSQGPQTFGVDTDPPTTPSTTPSATTSSSPTGSTDASTETSSPAPEEGGGSGLSRAALYGISFCSGIVAAILIGIGIRVWWRWESWRVERRRKAILAAIEEKYRNARNDDDDDGYEGNEGSGGRGNGAEEDAAPRLDVDVFRWRRLEGAGGAAKGGAGGAGARGERRDEPDGVACAV
jgi:hypothetical protein